MAISWTYLGGVWNTNSGSKNYVVAPSLGDLLIVVTAHSGNTSTATPTEDGGATYSIITTAQKNSSGDTMKVWVRSALITSTADLTITHNPLTSTGGGLFVFAVTEIQVVSTTSACIVQSAVQNNYIDAPDVVQPMFGAAVKNIDPVLVGFFNETNIPADIKRTGYTNQVSVGYLTPTSGFQAWTIVGGETGTIMTSSGNSATNFCSFAIEIDGNTYSNTGTPQKGLLLRGVK